MARTKLQIINAAFLRLGAARISSFAEQNDVARAANEEYHALKLEALASGNFRFCMRMAQLTRSEQEPKRGYDYIYKLPSDRLAPPRALYSTQAAGARPTTEFEYYENGLHSNAEHLWAEYAVDVEEALWPTYFTKYILAECCAVFANFTTSQQNTQNDWRSMADEELMKAMVADSQSSASRRVRPKHSVTDIRHGTAAARYVYEG